MGRLVIVALPTLLAACAGSAGADGTPPAGPGTGTGPDTDVPTSSETGSTGPAPTVGDVGWRLHDEIGSLATLTWTQAGSGEVRVEYAFDDEPWLSSPAVSRGSGDQEQLLLGIPFDREVRWRILAGDEVLAEGEGQRTGPAPADLPQPVLEVADPDRWFAGGRYLLTSVNQRTGGWTGGPFWTVILDRAGRTVWARLTPDGHWTLFAQVSARTGDHLLVDEDSMWSQWDLGADSRVARLYLDRPIDVVPTPGLQHAFVEHPDGTLAWGSLFHDDVESLVELAPGASEPTRLWTCRDWPGAGDCESNGLFFDPATRTYLYSFWTNHSVVAVDQATGQSLWWAGTVPGGYDFAPAWSQFWLQHGVSYTADGTLLLSSEEDGPTTAVMEYEVDHASRTLDLVWSFDAEAHAVTNGDAWRLANGNTLHVVGSAGVIKEAAPDGAVVWHVDYHAERLLGRGELLDDLYRFVAP